MAIRKGRGKIVAPMIHRCALEATKEYCLLTLRLVRVYPATLTAEAQRLLNGAWPIYRLALQMSYGELLASERAIAQERLAEVLSEVREALERHIRSRKNIVKEIRTSAVKDIQEAEAASRVLMTALIAKLRRRRIYRIAQVPGTPYLLLRTRPDVLMRRAVISQLLGVTPQASQKDMCKRLDFYGCPMPEDWRATEEMEEPGKVIDWKSAFRSAVLRRRLKKLLSDDVHEVRKWGIIAS